MSTSEKVAFSPTGLKNVISIESYSAPVPVSSNGNGKNAEAIQGAMRVEPGAALAEMAARKEWVEGSGIPEHLYKLNCFVGKDPQIITQATKWGVKYDAKPGKKITKKELGLGALDLSKGYWYTLRFDWQKNTIDPTHGQYKTFAKSFDSKGRQAKYLSTAGTGNAAYTLRVSEEEIRAVERRWGVEFSLTSELEADPDRVSELYWRWVLESPVVPVGVTEGIKKAACLIGQGTPTIALPGVNNIHSAKDATGITKQLTELRYLREEAKPVYLLFDSDLVDNAQVKTALRKLAAETSTPLPGALVGADCKICEWTNPKGIDDYFVKHGEQKLSQIFANAKEVGTWDEDLRDSDWYTHTLKNQIEKRFKLYFAAIGDSNHSEIYQYNSLTGAYDPCPEVARVVMGCLDKIAAPSNEKDGAESETTAGRPMFVREMLSCIKMWRLVKPSLVNPAGQWCTPNGVLSVTAQRDSGGRWSVDTDLRDHAPHTDDNPCEIFTECTEWVYDPHAQADALWQFLKFVPPAYVDTLLDFLSTSLALEDCRATLNRTDMPELLLRGAGSNGKDSMRKCLKALYMSRLSSIDLAAIKKHDKDTQKFGLTGMDERTYINFSSENSPVDLSKMETNKKLVTGDPVIVARKRQDQIDINITALQIHCTNRPMYMSNPQVSIVSRIQVMSLPYSFTSASKLAQVPEKDKDKFLLADPKFNDRRWLVQNILPALLNELLARLEVVLNRGSIDWSCCEHERDEMVGESRHLQGFLTSEFIKVTGDSTDFSSSVSLFSQYQQYCVSIDRATLSGLDFKEADPDCDQAKIDKLCLNATSFGRSFAEALGQKSVRRSVGKQQHKGFVGVVVCRQS
jgi:phage/plasmid-associated DNA primase